ncbi:PREDICTED: GRAM domain-containing protein 1B-like, partial [Galeopterus variegatus]|uniref:GRAM domain-containing protein 1B-like n=1 Tax=Galeopterus variegatus TaxID=482537 RepID=A0ABM0SGN7_GALVR
MKESVLNRKTRSAVGGCEPPAPGSCVGLSQSECYCKAKPGSWSRLIWQQQSTASNSNRSTPACSPILRKRSRSPTPQNQDGDAMVEKGSDHSSDKSPSTPEQGVQRSCSSQSGRSGGKNSK